MTDVFFSSGHDLIFCNQYLTWVIKLRGQWSLIRKGGSSIVRSGSDCQHLRKTRGGRELGSSDLGNRCESPINVVIRQQAKDADACHPTDKGLTKRYVAQVH